MDTNISSNQGSCRRDGCTEYPLTGPPSKLVAYVNDKGIGYERCSYPFDSGQTVADALLTSSFAVLDLKTGHTALSEDGEAFIIFKRVSDSQKYRQFKRNSPV